ncbi:hypothetical protein ABT336_14020 [Micromonospora sp. NPDC000207]|uniref:hypothetical protein n=1 Tax=Micromonospora sp. NPDC000207 TaxID=3154246 RepID=UPI00331B4853
MRVLAVPVQIDALWLPTERNVTGPAADFSRLPYVDATTGRDVNPDQPYLSDALLRTPFEEGFTLPAGVHLHWSLPDALTRVVHGEEPPRVPDRWLVTRTAPDGGRTRWVVESDALTDTGDAVGYPLSPDDPPGPTGRPYRRLGRTLPLVEWPGPDTDRVARLTALGHGEPTFAAGYPDSYSVFGFFDPDHPTRPPAGTRYDLLGFYSRRDFDELARVLRADDVAPWSDRITDRLGWATPPVDGTPPQRMVCVGRLTFDEQGVTTAPPGNEGTGVRLADTATEALAGHLGAVLPGVTPDEMERLLEALDHADELEAAALDLPIRLAEARHTTAFTPVPAGLRWTVRPQDAPPDTDAATLVAAAPERGGTTAARERADLPTELGDLLVALNETQADHDRARADVDGARRRLFADWHRYLICAYPPPEETHDYPDPDLVAQYLRRQMADLDGAVAETGEFPPTGPGDTLAHRLLAARRAVEQVVDAVNATAPDGLGYRLQHLPEAPYFLPNEPVVLVTGAAATPSDRYGRDDEHPGGVLPTTALELPEPTDPTTLAEAGDRIEAHLDTLGEPHPALRRWTGQPWHPVLLHWEVEFFPVSAGTNLGPHGRDYDPGFVETNYRLHPDEVELTPRPGRAVTDTAATSYTGTTVLSSAARPVLSTRILRYLAGEPLRRYNEERRAAGADPVSPEQTRLDPDPLLRWCADQTDDPRVRTLAAAYAHLATYESSNLAQSLGGFNDALVMRRLTRQLPIADPLGFPGDQELAAQVRDRVGDQNRQAPVPLADFNPIRAGLLHLNRLRIVDNFGVGHDVPVDRLAAATPLRDDERPGRVAMPPRLAAPARLRLLLLDADNDKPCSGLVESSPVCGWLLPDVLDDGLRVHAASGGWLGTLYPTSDPHRPELALWQAAPSTGVPAVEEIDNPRLRAVVSRLRQYGPTRFGELLGGLDDALDAVEPEGADTHLLRARLTGRPVAVVRLTVGLDLLGPPPIHQDWNVFREDLDRAGRETNDLPLVRFPVRIGEHGRLGDGVLGFWRHLPDGTLDADYHDVPTTADDPPLRLAFGLPDETLTVLLEPAGAIHATTGVLPTVSVRLDTAHHHDALARLETGFLVAPVLTDAAGIGLALPSESGRRWTWRERDATGWTETDDPPGPQAGFPTDLTAREGWLALRTPPAPTR